MTDDSDFSHHVLLCTAQATCFGFPVTAIRGIVGAQAITSVPMARGPIEGITNLRGRIVSVFDLARCMDVPIVACAVRPMTIIIDHRHALYGFRVDTAESVFDKRLTVPATMQSPAAWQSFAPQIRRCGDRSVVFLEPPALIERISS